KGCGPRAAFGRVTLNVVFAAPERHCHKAAFSSAASERHRILHLERDPIVHGDVIVTKLQISGTSGQPLRGSSTLEFSWMRSQASFEGRSGPSLRPPAGSLPEAAAAPLRSPGCETTGRSAKTMWVAQHDTIQIRTAVGRRTVAGRNAAAAHR